MTATMEPPAQEDDNEGKASQIKTSARRLGIMIWKMLITKKRHYLETTFSIIIPVGKNIGFSDCHQCR